MIVAKVFDESSIVVLFAHVLYRIVLTRSHGKQIKNCNLSAQMIYLINDLEQLPNLNFTETLKKIQLGHDLRYLKY